MIGGTPEIREVGERLFDRGGMFLVDLDDTTKEGEEYLWADGVVRRVLPETVASFLALSNSRVKLGIVTEQSFPEMLPFISEVCYLSTGKNTSPFSLFNGLIVGEGGAVVKAFDGDVRLVAPKEAQKQREVVLSWLKQNIVVNGPDGWGTIFGLDPLMGTPVKLPSEPNQGEVSISLWEHGPHLSVDPTFAPRYAKNKQMVDNVIFNLGLTALTTYEAGNGTLRIVPRYVNKARTLGLLHSFGVIDLSKIVFAGDGLNDVALAKKIRLMGGRVAVFGNAVVQMRQVSNYSTSLPSGLGFAKLISELIPKEYEKAFWGIKSKGLDLVQKYG